MFWLYLLISIGGSIALAAVLSFFTVRWLAKREPYSSFVRLPMRRKLTFFRLLLLDPRVPLNVKAILIFAVVYVVSPIDLVPAFVVDDVAVALLALVLVVRLTPPQVFQDIIQRAAAADSQTSTTASSPPGASPLADGE